MAGHHSKDWHDWPYFAGDGAVQAEDGYFRILGFAKVARGDMPRELSETELAEIQSFGTE